MTVGLEPTSLRAGPHALPIKRRHHIYYTPLAFGSVYEWLCFIVYKYFHNQHIFIYRRYVALSSSNVIHQHFIGSGSGGRIRTYDFKVMSLDC